MRAAFEFLIAVTVVVLLLLSQVYWFAQAWRFAGRFRRIGLRNILRAFVLIVTALLVGIALSGVVLSLSDGMSQGSWWRAFLGFWLASSILSYVAVKLVGGLARVFWSERRAEPSSAGSPDEAVRRFPANGPVGSGRPDLGSVGTNSPDASEANSPNAPSIALTDAPIDRTRRRFVQTASVLVGAIPFTGALYGFLSERFNFEVRQIEIPIANLSAALDGFRITQLSDIHVGSYMPLAQVRRVVGMANELDGDIAVVTGDFLTGKADPLEACVAEISKLRAPLGTWGCNGNHEIYAHAEAEAATLFSRFGMKLLRHESAELQWHGSAFNLIGVDYQVQTFAHHRLTPMLAGVDSLVRRDVPNILLSHNPNSFPRAAELGIELSLAGHTHGGQVKVEILDHRWSPARFLTPYVAGLYDRPQFTPAEPDDSDDAHDAANSDASAKAKSTALSRIYVNRGIGTVGAPIRLGVAPEITLITLRRVV